MKIFQVMGCTILIFIISTQLAPSFNVELIRLITEVKSFREIRNNKGKTAILCIVNDNIPSRWDYGTVLIHENGNWIRTPDTIKVDGIKFPLSIQPSSSIHFDSTGAVWVSGQFMHKFYDGAWNFYCIHDSDLAWRNYQRFCIDKFNNLWITTSVYHDTLAQYSELLKFDGEKFTTVLKFNDMPLSFRFFGQSMYTNNIIALTDGRIMVHRIINSYEEDAINNQKEDIYFINQDLTYDRVLLQSPSGSDFDNWHKVVSSIFPETSDKIWFALDYSIVNGPTPEVCCSGLMLYENGSWSAMDDKYGFEKRVPDDPRSVYLPIYTMIDMQDYYFLLGNHRIYKFGKDYSLEKKSWFDVLENPCKFIVPNSLWNESHVELFLGSLADEKKSHPIMYQPIKQENGEIWLALSGGILIFHKDIIAGLENENGNANLTLYPNPASEFLKINVPENYIKYQIVDLLGILLKEGHIDEGQISISDLSNGLYFIKLIKSDSEQLIRSFIKN